MSGYDTVIVRCPKCGTHHQAQSKGGRCVLGMFILEEAPQDVLSDVNRHAPFKCELCQERFMVWFVPTVRSVP